MLQELAGQNVKTPVVAPAGRRDFRPELQGLRALAVLLVVVYHVWLDRVSGGVDVFFVISGFLLTGQLTRAVAKGRVEFRPLWGRMIMRLLPAALTVLVAVMAVAIVVLPEPRWFQTIREVVAAALYVENWQLAADSVDYFAQNNGKSVVQHFWSLSIQGQLFIVWPLLITVVAVAARRFGGGLRLWVAGTLGVLGTASLTYSIYLTAVNQPLAYFHSLTRVWEFVLGGLLALFVDAVPLPRLARVVLGWAGVAGLVSGGLILQVGTVFPGYAALWPTLSAAAVLLAGASGDRRGADRFLSSRPLRYLGDISYSLYLWHWPVLIFYLIYRETPRVGIKGGAVVIAVSLVLAALTHRYVEEPARTSAIGEPRGWGAYKFGLALLAGTLALAGTWQFVTVKRAEFAFTIDDPDHPGAAARYPGFRYQGQEDVTPIPPPAALLNDWGSTDGMDCEEDGGNQAICTSAPAGGAPARRVVLIGDSHMQQFLPALRPIADKRRWELTVFLKGACPFSTDAYVPDFPQECVDWNARARDRIVGMRPDLVLTQASRDVRVGLTEETPPGFVAQWQALTAAGIPVVAMRDTPRHPMDPSQCAQARGPDAPECATPRAELYAPTPPWVRAENVPSSVKFLDFTDFLCDTQCRPVIGNVYVYRDFNHPTATFMRTMSPIVEEKLLATMKW